MPKPSPQFTWTDGSPTKVVEPSGPKKILGWQALERPPFEYMNWLFYHISNWLLYFESVTDLRPLTVQAVASSYSPTTADHVILFDATTGNKTVNLPAAASSVGLKLVIKKVDGTANTVTIDGNASETIDGQLTYPLEVQFESVEIVCGNGGWNIV